jgi:hypothetical protein
MTPDRKIRDWFERLKQDDARIAPTFASSWRAAESRMIAVRRPSLLLRFAAVGAVLVLAATGTWIGLKQRPARPAAAITQLSQWRAPTDFLLETPGSEFLRTVPRFGGLPIMDKPGKHEEQK